MKKTKKKTGDIDWEQQGRFDAATAWFEKLDQSPHVKDAVDLYSDDLYAAALDTIGPM